jgi:hypothetical protein
MLVMFKAMVVLVSVSVELLAALVVPTATCPKFCEAGNSVALATPVPVPVSVTT